MAHEIYKGTKQAKLLCHLKIDLFMTKLFETFTVTKVFGFKEELNDVDLSSDEEDDQDKKGDLYNVAATDINNTNSLNNTGENQFN